MHLYAYSDYLAFMNKGHKAAIIKGFFTKNGMLFAVHSLFFMQKHHLLFQDDIAKRMLYCLSFIAFYRTIKTNDAIIIMDEGIIQGVISALFTNTCNEMNFLWLAKTVQQEKIIPVFLQTPKKVANERILSRNMKNHSRCDSIENNKERCYVLEQEEKNFILFYENLTNVGVPHDSTDAAAVNIEKILAQDLHREG